jgi:hypothetical protein
VPAPDQPFDLPHGVEGAPLGTVPKLLRLQVGLEDRLQDQHRSHLHYTVLDARDPERPLLAIRFRDVHASDRSRDVRSLAEVIRQFVQPPVHAVGLDVLERLAVESRRATVGTAAGVGPRQHVSSVQLVVQRIEPIVGRLLRFGVQRRLEFPNLRWR